MKKILFIAFASILGIAILLSMVVIFKIGEKNDINQIVTTGKINLVDGTYIIDDESVTLRSGFAESNIVDGSSSKKITRYFGNDAIGDLNNDGKNDIAFLLTQETGGSGIFYYVAVALGTNNGYTGLNAVLLGDRIAPQSTEIKDGKVIVNYAVRNVDEPMTTKPSIGVSTYLFLEDNILKIYELPSQIISYLVSSEDSLKYCNGSEMDSDGYRETINTEKTFSIQDANLSKAELAKAVINEVTSDMCHDALTNLNISEKDGVVYIPDFGAWAGVSIVMCSCKPLAEVNLLRISGINEVIWSAPITSFDECVATGAPVMESYPRQCRYNNKTFVEDIGNELDKSDLIIINNPRPNQTVSSPILINGEARGNWFFEASFPIFLTDWDGRIIAEGYATAKSDWMTTEFVPFEATLEFSIDKDIYSNKGTLILKKDNPSGLSEFDDALEIPVILNNGEIAKVCTMEAKICPDGSAVGRTGQNCEFAPCPMPNSILPYDSGVEGVITLGPTCPVMRVGDDSCNDKPYATDIQVIAKGSIEGSIFVNTSSDKNGVYKIMLPPGEYTIKPVGGSVLPRCESKEIIIDPSKVIKVDFSCDSGIR